MKNQLLKDIIYDALIITDIQGNFIDFNEKACTMLGYSKEEFSSLNVSDVEANENIEEIQQHMKNIIKKGTDRFDTCHKTKDGSLIDVNIGVSFVEHNGEKIFALTIHPYSESELSRKKLEEENTLKAIMLDNIADAVFLHTPEGKIVYTNQIAWKERGYTQEEILKMTIQEIDAPEHIKDFDKLIERIFNGEVVQFQRNHLKKNGDKLPLEINSRKLQYDDSLYMLSITRDISERINHEALEKSHYNTLQKIFDSIPSLIVYSNGTELLKTNNQLLNLFGYKTIEEFKAEHLCICDYFIEKKGYIKNGSWVEQVKEMQSKNKDALVLIENPSTYDKMIFTIRLIDFDDGNYLAIFDDVTALHSKINHLKDVAEHDLLTGALNRASVFNLLGKLDIKAYSILFLDIDYFKNINDTFGHHYGDLVLKKVVEIFRKSVRKSDIVSRWGGEEFLILLPNTLLKDSLVTAEKIRVGIQEYYKNSEISLTISIGVSGNCTDDFDACLKRADAMLYEAKNSGRNCVKPTLSDE